MSDAADPARFQPEELLAHADWARGLASHLVRDPGAADDLVQDALVAAIRRPPVADRPLRPWLAGVLRKLALARRRGEGRRAKREALVAGGSETRHAPSVVDVAARLDAHRALAEVVAALPEPLRGTVYLRYYEGLDSTEIAERHGVPAATVRWRLAKALDELRVRLDARSPGGRNEWLAAVAPLAMPRPTSPAVKPKSSSAPVAAVLSGVLAMATTTKILLGGAALVAVLALLWTTNAVDLGGSPRARAKASTDDVAEAGAIRPDKRDAPPRAPRKRGSADTSTPAPTETTTAGETPTPERSTARLLDVRARVLDFAGAAAAGARVEVGTAPAAPGGDGDADGRVAFTADAADVGSNPFFVVSATRCATRIVAGSLPTDGRVIDLGEVRLGAGGSVAGYVTDADGPIAGAQVGVLTTSADQAQVVDSAPVAETGADGRFTLRGVPAGDVQISVGKRGFDSAVQAVAVVTGEERFGLAFVLVRRDPALMVRGVVQTPDGAPAPRSVVTYRYEGHGSTGAGSTTCDEDGRFEIEGGKDKTWRISARDASGRWSSSLATELRSGADGVVLRLTDTRWIDLAVRRDGIPVERFAVEVRSDGGHLPGEVGITLERLSDEARAEGVARLRLPAQPFVVLVTAQGCSTATAGPFEPSSVGSRIEVPVAALPGLTGRVTAAGIAVAKARVTLRQVVAQGMREIRNGFACLTSQAWDTGVAETAADGTFNVTLRVAGRFVLRAEAPDFAPAEAGPFDVTPDVGRAGIAFALTKGGAIEGRVLVVAGRDADGTIVGISRGDGEARTVRTGPDGAFRFEHLTPGPWLVRQTEREIRPDMSTVTTTSGEAKFDWSCRVEEGATTHFDVDLVTEKGTAVRGELRVDGKPAGGWKVEILSGTGLFTAEETAAGTVAESGSFRLLTERKGDGFVRARSPQGLYVFAPIKVGDVETSVSVEVLTGQVKVRGATPGEALMLLCEEAGGRCAVAEAAMDADGACGPTQVPAGRVRLVRPKVDEMDPRKWPTVVEGDLAAGGSLVLDVPSK